MSKCKHEHVCTECLLAEIKEHQSKIDELRAKLPPMQITIIKEYIPPYIPQYIPQIVPMPYLSSVGPYFAGSGGSMNNLTFCDAASSANKLSPYNGSAQ